jgi:hypothetical protein
MLRSLYSSRRGMRSRGNFALDVSTTVKMNIAVFWRTRQREDDVAVGQAPSI